MRILLIAIALLCVTFSVFAQEDVRRVVRHNNHSQVTETFFVKEIGDNIKHGYCELEVGGKVCARGNYVNNKKNGQWIYTNKYKIYGSYKNGFEVGQWIYLLGLDTVSMLKFKRGKFHGKQIGYYPNGQIACSLEYDKGVFNGVQKYYFENGNLKETASYVNGVLHGDKMICSKNGRSISRISYYENNPIHIEVIKGKSLLKYFKGDLSHGNGKLEYYSKDKDGNDVLRTVRNFRDSVLHGDIMGFGIGGDTTFVGQYDKGYMVGKWTFYNSKGKFDHRKKYAFSDKKKFDSKESVTMNYNNSFITIYEMAEFPYGNLQLRKYIAGNVKYPTKCRMRGVQGRVFVQFTVNRVGEIARVKTARGVHKLLDAEAERVIKSMPNWTPGFKFKIPVKISYTVPINFVLN
ncbi:TonB family protein [bacterium]|nr:TonB family protein [bacterium]